MRAYVLDGLTNTSVRPMVVVAGDAERITGRKHSGTQMEAIVTGCANLMRTTGLGQQTLEAHCTPSEPNVVLHRSDS
jgi:hypothetical protein